MVPGAGLEPARCCHRRILSPLRLPISPPGHRANAEVGTLFQIFELAHCELRVGGLVRAISATGTFNAVNFCRQLRSNHRE